LRRTHALKLRRKKGTESLLRSKDRFLYTEELVLMCKREREGEASGDDQKPRRRGDHVVTRHHMVCDIKNVTKLASRAMVPMR
jgi:hypothetical protein